MKFQLDSSKPRIFSSTSSPSTGWKFSFLILSETEKIIAPFGPSITVTALFPRRILLLALTVAPLPIAVALVRFPEDKLALNPMAMLLLPVVLLTRALSPVAVLALPVVLLASALTPVAVLLVPVVLLRSAKAPLAVL